MVEILSYVEKKNRLSLQQNFVELLRSEMGSEVGKAKNSPVHISKFLVKITFSTTKTFVQATTKGF